MKCFLIAAILLSSCGFTLAQEDVKTKHDAYYRCVDNIETNPHKAFDYCREYLNKYPNDNKRMVEFAGKFVAAYNKISQYTKSAPLTYFAEGTTTWAVYSPGLVATIPSENSRESREAKYSIVIKREFGSADEQKLLAKAEAVYKNPETVEPELLRRWDYVAQDTVVLPKGEPKWWKLGSINMILLTEVVTTEAVLYYYNLSQALRNGDGKLKGSAAIYQSSDMKYEASIKKMNAYERSGRSFTDVYIANMTLTWGQICGFVCGSGFTRNKVVVMTSRGEILELFLDDPMNRFFWIS